MEFGKPASFHSWMSKSLFLLLTSIANPRILTVKERTLSWQLDIHQCPGKWTLGPDALSRYPGKVSVSLSIIREQTDEKDDLQYITHNESSKIASLHAFDELGSVTFDHITNAA